MLRVIGFIFVFIYVLLFVFVVFETESPYISQTDLTLPKFLASALSRSSVAGVNHYSQLAGSYCFRLCASSFFKRRKKMSAL